MLDLAGDGVDEEVVDAGPVTVDGGFGGPGAAAELIDGEACDAFGDEQLDGGVADPLVCAARHGVDLSGPGGSSATA